MSLTVVLRTTTDEIANVMSHMDTEGVSAPNGTVMCRGSIRDGDTGNEDSSFAGFLLNLTSLKLS